MPIFANEFIYFYFIFVENIGPAAAGPAGPVSTPMTQPDSYSLSSPLVIEPYLMYPKD